MKYLDEEILINLKQETPEILYRELDDIHLFYAISKEEN